MILKETPLPGLMVVETSPHRDDRGQFVRVFCDETLSAYRPALHFSQINLSTTSHKGTVRGMHFQRPPMGELKLIRCVQGRVFDVAVDLRTGSPTFLRWFGLELSSDNQRQMLIPEGFAHGFQTLTDNAQLLYMHTKSWSRGHEGGVRPNDPRLGIAWPLPIEQLSERDSNAPPIDANFPGIAI